MKTRKYILCQYPSNGFGSKSNQFYLMNQYGSRFDIVDDYDKTLGEMNKSVCLGDLGNIEFTEPSMSELIATVEEYTDTKIERW